jgi:hypothetical protein
MYGLLMLKLFQFLFSVVGLVPAEAAITRYGLQVPFCSVISVLFNLFKSTGPTLLLAARTVAKKSNPKIAFNTSWIFMWILWYCVSWMCLPFAFMSDFWFIATASAGMMELLYYSWETSGRLSPIVQLISVDLKNNL